MLFQWQIGLAQKISVSSQYNTLIATACAVVAAYFVVRRLTRYPGVAGMSYILPTFTVAYALALFFFVFFRLDYSRFFLLASFLSAQLWFHFICMLSSRTNKLSFAVVPGGNAGRLAKIKNVDWRFLTKPTLEGKRLTGVTADLRADLAGNWEAFIAETAISGIPVYHYKQIGETLTGKVEIEHLSENNLGSLLPNFVYLRFKQWIDIAVAVALLPLLLPMFAVIGLLIRLDSSGPVFFRQPRMGFQGDTFRVWKFRSMVHGESAASANRDAAITRNADPRITRLGHVLRKSRLDELPQVFNILRGEMSWIGPRPEAVPLSHWYEKELPFYRYRHIVRPGISGWAQVNQGHVADVDDVRGKLHYDFYYIKNFSVWLDVLIAMRTVATILTGFGAR
jgi:lipopolysaccharide/colanic/teichoic acid biosynthesis glycosyltransferase